MGRAVVLHAEDEVVVERVKEAMSEAGHKLELLKSNLSTEQEGALREMMSS